MKLNKERAYVAIEEAYVIEIAKKLEREGFRVYREYSPMHDKSSFRIDIFAEKDKDRRIYEIKMGPNKIDKNKYLRLQKMAKELEAKLYISYIEKPKSCQISFEGIEELLKLALRENIDKIITENPVINEFISVNSVELSMMDIKGTTVKIEGAAIAESQLCNCEKNEEVDFVFRLTYDICKRRIEHLYSKFDLSYVETKNVY